MRNEKDRQSKWEFVIDEWDNEREKLLLTIIVFGHFIRDLAVVIYLISSHGAS